MSFEVSKLFVLSTSHIPENKRQELDELGNELKHGWLISTYAIEDKVKDDDFSWLNPILYFVRREEAQYVMFDSDGPVYSQLMRYDW